MMTQVNPILVLTTTLIKGLDFGFKGDGDARSRTDGPVRPGHPPPAELSVRVI